MDREMIERNARAIRASYQDRAERKARVAHIRRCGGVIPMLLNDAIVATALFVRERVDEEGCAPVFAAAQQSEF